MRTTEERRRPGAELARATFGLGILLAVAGCTKTTGAGAAAPATRSLVTAQALAPTDYKNGGNPNPDDPYTFDIAEDTQGCPIDVSMEDAYRKCTDRAKDCVHVKGGQTVRFRSPSNDFMLQFDPFDRNSIASGGKPLVLTTKKNPKPAKPYTFTIRRDTPACSSKVVDPQIILD